MPTLRTPLKRKTRSHINQAAIDAWLAGDVWGLANALGLKPWEHGVLPSEYTHAYCLPDQPDHGLRGLEKCKAYKEQLIELVGLPPNSVKVAACKKRLEDAESSLAYSKTDMARLMYTNGGKSEQWRRDHIRDVEERVASASEEQRHLETRTLRMAQMAAPDVGEED